RGTVVHRNAKAQSFVVAGPGGRLTAIHASHSPAVGRYVVASVRRLRNGTFALRHVRAGATRRRVRARGVVTYVDRATGSFTLSAEGVSMLVSRGARRAAIASALPSVGTRVDVSGDVSGGGSLEATSIRDDGTAAGAVDIEGSLTEVNATTRTLLVSSEDDALTAGTVTVIVPESFEMSKFTVGQEVQLQVTLQTNGTYLLTGSSSDEGTSGAEDRADQQGEETDAADHEDEAASGTSSDSGSSSSDGGGSSTSSSGSGSATATGTGGSSENG
ncbi:MAG: hypothetical protein KGJ43_01725, partial [Acidobacteriota bacterium]|nr:hypothetical protein [Acidobacteriota bacterium]